MSSWVIGFQDIDNTQLSLVGGKGLNLGLLANVDGIQVPEGFCITTLGFQEALRQNETYHALLQQLNMLNIENRKTIGEISNAIRAIIEEAELPSEVVTAVTHYLSKIGENQPYAVRSSATAEDLPHASFAGQQDSYLNIIGLDAILQHISKCWASLFTERAVIYRIQNGFDHSQIQISVIVQRMVLSEASGIMFTADPITNNRKLLSIDAGFGLGEAFVSGLVSADCYKVQDGEIVDTRIANKKLAIYGLSEGGTEARQLNAEQENAQTLTKEQIIELERIGKRIEAYYGCPQDIEWCLVQDTFYIVQSRPITTLFPIPEAKDQEKHVYISVGHQQMMTDAMKPLGLSLWHLTSNGPRFRAGGRLFVDIAPMLRTSLGRADLLNNIGKSEPLIRDALITIIERDFIPLLPGEDNAPIPATSNTVTDMYAPIDDIDPTIVSDLINSSQASIEELRQQIQLKAGTELIDFILEDIQLLKKNLFTPESLRVIMAAMDASAWINDHMKEWLGEINVADKLSQSVHGNITSEMGLELLGVADIIRPYPEVITYLQQVKDDNFLEGLVKLEGGIEARDAIQIYLNKYGMRCAGEIDITRTRFSEKPSTLIPLILNNIKNFKPNAGIQKFEQGRLEAMNKEQEILDRLRHLQDGDLKAKETKRLIDIIRNLSGNREYPKYSIVNRYFLYKQALLKEAQQLVQAGIIAYQEDIFYLSLDELHEAIRDQKLDQQLISLRKEEHKGYEKLTPPRMITSEGEIISGQYNRDNIPEQALVGLAVSSGVIEGRARVILTMDEADLEEGDILITSFTDPSWTPLFVSIKGLITEVGGLMTHGAVIAREYGIPTVVGVEHATKLIQDGRRIRVNGTEGYVELL